METPPSHSPKAPGPEAGKSPIADAASTEPPHRAHGGGEAAIPPLVIRGESTWTEYDPVTGERVIFIPSPRGPRYGLIAISLPNNEISPYAAITDWLNFSFPLSLAHCELEKLFESFSAFLAHL